MTALEIQRLYLRAALAHAAEASTPALPHAVPDTETAEVLEAWEEVLTDLETDLARAADRIDWIAKLQLLESYRRRDGLDWDSARLGMIDLQYHDLRVDKGLYYRLADAGRMRRLFTDEQITWAANHPPEETRAWLRGTLVTDYRHLVAGASWDQVLLRPDEVSPPVRLYMPQPEAGRRVEAEAVLTSAEDPHSLISGLQELLKAP